MSVRSLSPISESAPSPVQVSIRKKSTPVNLNSTQGSDKLDDSTIKGSTLSVRKSSHVAPSSQTAPSTDGRSAMTTPAYTEQWDDISSYRKTAMDSPLTHRSRESGRLSPVLDPASVEVGNQPLQLPRFNESLKLRKGRKFVDYPTQAPTVVYVPHRKFAHGRFTNVSVQTQHGRYVVIEQRPVHTRFSDMSDSVKQRYHGDTFGPDTSWTKKKSPWKWSSKGNFIERSVNRGFYEPYLPPVKSQFGNVGSRVGSMDNYEHRPGGGTHRVPSFKLKWESEAKINSLPPTFRSEESPTNELKLPNVTPRFGASAASGSFTSIHYTPGGNVFLRKQHNNAKSRIGSLDNVSHSPGGGDIAIPQKKVKWKQESKIGSLDNITHLPKSSNVQIFDEKLAWKTGSKIGSLDNAEHYPSRSRFRVPNFPKDWSKSTAPKVGSLSNMSHRPGGGNAQIIDLKPKWKAESKIDSKWKFNYDYQSLFVDDDDELDMQSFSHASSHPFTV